MKRKKKTDAVYNVTSLLSTVFWETLACILYSIIMWFIKKANFYLQCLRIEVLSVVKMLIVFWDGLQCSLVGYKCFWETMSIFRVELVPLVPPCHHISFPPSPLDDTSIYLSSFSTHFHYHPPLLSPLWLTGTLKMEVVCFSKMLVTTCTSLMSDPRTSTKDTIYTQSILKYCTPSWSTQL
jgi:hypothetical protein